jgi:hypothetical protein
VSLARHPDDPLPAVAPGPQQLAVLAQAFEQRLDALAEHVDASWEDVAPWRSALRETPPGSARRRLLVDLFERWCGPLPSLLELATPAGRLATMPRLTMLTRLCALALAARPGAVRCCIERPARQGLEQALGPVLPLLRDASRGGVPVSSEVAAWSPMQWACAGYADLLRARGWRQRSLRRLVRLALPAALPVPLRLSALPLPQLTASAALRQVDDLFEGGR